MRFVGVRARCLWHALLHCGGPCGGNWIRACGCSLVTASSDGLTDAGLALAQKRWMPAMQGVVNPSCRPALASLVHVRPVT